MRIQLLLANQEVELNNNVQIPLNKSYQNLWNPTDIIVDYSKNISIPMTVINNRILGNAYRLDRTIIENAGADNIGIYLDPTKKIPFQLLYNGQSLMEGYAKFVSANYSEKNKVYNMNLFGSLGAYFLKMKGIVTSYDKLTDDQKANGGDKYVLNDHLNNTSLNAEYVKQSWLRTNNNPNDFSDPTITDQDIVGFAPAYRGYYGMNFKSDRVQTTNGEIMSLATLLKEEWRTTYCWQNYYKPYSECSDSQKEIADAYAEKLGADNVIGDGLKEYQMDEYRSYHQRPFIYFNKLLYMFQEKSKDLTGYDLLLDNNWFNENNPYWTKLVYTLNYLEDIDEIPSTTQSGGVIAQNFTLYKTPTNDKYLSAYHTSKHTVNSSVFKIDGMNLSSNIYLNLDKGMYTEGLTTRKHCAIVYKFDVKSSKGTLSQVRWGSIGKEYYEPNLKELETVPSMPSESFKITAIPFWYTNVKDMHLYIEAKLDDIEFDLTQLGDVENEELTLDITVEIYSDYDSPFYIKVISYDEEMIPLWRYFDNASAILLASDFSIRNNASNSISLGLDKLYMEEDPIFDIVLQYTKMYGLLWKADDINKTITICRRSTYFDDISLNSWDNKLDRSKDYVIEPITFETKYVNFNYEDCDGYKYKSYKDKYGAEYGAYKLNTSYDFDSGDVNLFSGINTSLISQRSFVKYADLRDWDLKSYIKSNNDPIARIESVDNEDSTAINKSSWYFRNGNIALDYPVYITDDSPLMIQNKEYCWYTNAWKEELANVTAHVKSINELPSFSVVTDGYTKQGCLFKRPKEDYTLNKSIAEAKDNFVYDNFWKDYIDERYSVQNKKLTAYFNITPHDYLSFDFNKLVTLNGQLFMVNKIFDYDLNSSATTKCELVQITDLSAYTSDTLDVSEPEEIPVYEIIVNPNPTDAKVYINNNLINTLKVEHGTSINIRVEKENYIAYKESFTAKEDRTIDVTLEKDTSIIRTFAIDPDPADAKVVINGNEGNILRVNNWDIVQWEVSKEGYHTQTGELEVTQDITIPVWLTEEYKDVLTFTIVPDPSDAEVVINSTPTKSIETEEGAYITWIVRKEGYTTRTDTFQIYESKELPVKLEKKGVATATFTINPTPSDANVYMYVRSDSDSPSEYAGTEAEGVGKLSITAAVGDWISWSVRRDGYKLLSGTYQLQTSEDYTYDAVLEELGAIKYDLLTHPDKSQTINGDAQTLTFKVSSRKYVPREDGSGSDVEFLDVNYSNAVNCTVTKQDNIAGDAKDFVVSIPENNTGADRYSTFTVTQDETNDTIDFSIKQRTNAYTLEQYSLVEAISYEGGDRSVEVQSLKNNKALPFTTDNVSISGINLASIKSVEAVSERGEGIYRINFSIPKNTTSEDRIAIITVTQPGSNYTLDIEADQGHEAPTSTKKATVRATATLNNNKVFYEVEFDATKDNGGTLKNVTFQVRDASGVSGNLISSKSEGDITVTKGSKSDIYVGQLSAGNLSSPWFQVYYDNALQYYGQCFQEDLEPINEEGE